jgi:hypothetical protein
VKPTDFAYVAALVDNLGKLSSRVVHRDELPVVTIQGKHAALPWLAEVSGVQLMQLDKSYTRHQCSEHCPDKHMPIDSWTHRWQVTGARAIVVLWNVEPYMRAQAAEARRLLRLGGLVAVKGTTIFDMAERGWPLPDRERLMSA